MKKAIQYVKSGDHLPDFLKDFHDQKNLFKCMHYQYEDEDEPKKPSWVDGQIYVIDWFLWYVGQRGYKLQKSRANVDWKEFEDIRELAPSILEVIANKHETKASKT